MQDSFLNGEVEFDPIQLESAISSTIFDIVEDEGSVYDAAKQVNYTTCLYILYVLF